MVKNLPANAGDAGSILGFRRPLEKEITIHSSILAWEIPWTEEAGGLQSMVLQKSQIRLSDQTITTMLLLLLLSRFSRVRPCATP